MDLGWCEITKHLHKKRMHKNKNFLSVSPYRVTIKSSRFLQQSLFKLLLFFSLCSQAFAQRGQDFQSSEEPEASKNQATSGFSGTLDTQMPAKGEWNLSMPTGWIERGMSDKVTLGINPLATGLSTLGGGLGLLAKSRYRLYGSSETTSALTLYGGFFNLSRSAQPINIYIVGGTSNSTYFFNNRHSISLHLVYFSVRGVVGSEGSLDYGDVSLSALSAGIGYGLHFAKFTGEVTILFPKLTIELNSAAQESSLDLGDFSQNSLALKFLGNIAAGKSWLFSPGLLILTSGGVLPLFDASVKY